VKFRRSDYGIAGFTGIRAAPPYAVFVQAHKPRVLPGGGAAGRQIRPLLTNLRLQLAMLLARLSVSLMALLLQSHEPLVLL
jgi:hypothetical protein